MSLTKIDVSPPLSAIAFGVVLLLNLVGARPSKAQVVTLHKRPSAEPSSTPSR